MKKFPIRPANPERLCWGCDRYCAADNMLCGNGSDRTQHPVELFGEDWERWGQDYTAESTASSLSPPQRPGDSTSSSSTGSE